MKPYYQDDYVTIYHGDCREILSELPDKSVDLVLTDPPYGTGGRDGAVHLENKAVFCNRMGREAYMWLMGMVARLLYEKTKDDAHCYVLSDWRRFKDVQIAFEASGWENRSLIVWNKGNGMGEFWRSCHEFILFFTKMQPKKLSHGACFNVINIPAKKNKEHPAEKPIELSLHLMCASGSDIALDPFMGTGSTLLAAKKLNRKCIGIEIEEKYCEIAANRCRQMVMELKL